MRRTKTGLLRIDRAAAQRKAHYDGKWLLRTSDLTLTPEDLAAAYKHCSRWNAAGATAKPASGCARGLPPPRGPHPRSRPIVLAGTAAHPRRGNPHRRHLAQPAPRTRPHAPVTLATTDGRVAQRSALTSDHKTVLPDLDLPEPPKYLDFTPIDSAHAD